MKFALPKEFLAARGELTRFCAVQSSRAILLSSDSEALPTRGEFPEGLLPFMNIEEPAGWDLYALDFSWMPPAVVVWSDHAVVERWENFDVFMKWIRGQDEAALVTKC